MDPEAPGGAAQQPRESTRRPVASPLPPFLPGELDDDGSSNSRSRSTGGRTPPPSPRQLAAVWAALEEGLTDYDEAERLIGFLMMGGQGLSARTVRRRQARLQELGVPERSPDELQAWELRQMVDRGEIGYLEAERRMGRFTLAGVGPLGWGALAAPPAG